MTTNEMFVAELSKLRPGSTFLTLHKYMNAAGEVADYSIVFHMSYKSAIERSVSILEGKIPSNDIEVVAKAELLTSFQKSLEMINNPPDASDNDAYSFFSDENGTIISGVKLHKKTNALHIFGLIVHKKLYMPASVKVVNHLPLTTAKNKLREDLPVTKFRQFKITSSQVDRITVQKIDLLPPTQG